MGTRSSPSDTLASLKSAEALKLDLAVRIVAALDRQRLTVREAQARTGQAAADLSRLRGGQIDRFTIERLLGRKVDLVELALRALERMQTGPWRPISKMNLASPQSSGSWKWQEMPLVSYASCIQACLPVRD